MQFENLKTVKIDSKTMQSALELMKLCVTPKPRDAIHLATALDEGISTIVSDDVDFDHINGIKRTALDD